MNTKGMIVLGGVAAAALLLMATQSNAQAQEVELAPLPEPKQPVTKQPEVKQSAPIPLKTALQQKDVLITDHDSVYDYLYKESRWFTRRKGNTTWIDMKNALTPANYELATSKLTTYLLSK